MGIALYGVVREGLPGEVQFEQRPGESKGLSYMDIRGKSAPVRRNNKYKDPEKSGSGIFKERPQRSVE